MKQTLLYIKVIFFTIVFFIAIFFIQNRLTLFKDETWFKERMSYLPQTEKIRPYLLGFSTTYANYLWIKTMLYFGSHYSTDKDYTWLVTMVDMVTKLNPYFYPAYEFAGVMIPTFSEDPDAARVILDRGITFLGNKRYNIPFYLGWIYYNKYNDSKIAADYLVIASQNRKAPVFFSTLASTLYHNAGKKDLARDFLYSAYNSSENPIVKKIIKDKIISLDNILKNR